MALQFLADHWMGWLRCSYKKATLILCAGNVLVALFMLHTALAPAYFFDSSSSSSSPASRDNIVVSPSGVEVVQTKEDLERIEDSNRIRRELLPVELIDRVKEIQEEAEIEMNRTEALNQAREKVASELTQRLRELKFNNSHPPQQDGGKEVVDSRIKVLAEETPQASELRSEGPSQKVATGN